MNHVRSDVNYAILTKQVKLQHEKKSASNLKCMQSVGFEKIPLLFLVFHSWISGSDASWVYLQISKYIQVKIMKHLRSHVNYTILTKQVKLQNEKKSALNLKCMQSEGFEQTFTNLVRLLFQTNTFCFTGKKTIVENISVAITDSSSMCYFDRCLINIFLKSIKAERCTDIMFKLTLHCLSATVEDPNSYIMKIYIWRYKYFRYMLFYSPQCYFRCTAGTQLEHGPNFSCPTSGPNFRLEEASSGKILWRGQKQMGELLLEEQDLRMLWQADIKCLCLFFSA